MLGKPKLLFIQACRGQERSRTVSLMEEEEDASAFYAAAGAPPGAAPRKVSSVGEYSDMIIARSTIPGRLSFYYHHFPDLIIGFVSIRNTRLGSWFIQDLTKVFMENAHDTPVRKMLDKVFVELNKRKSGEFKQVAEYTNIGFTKDLYLHPGLEMP